jgi:RimJ/RimL family protein N-acetyltransferase
LGLIRWPNISYSLRRSTRNGEDVTTGGNLHSELESEFTEYAVDQAHPQVRSWRGDLLRRDIQEATKALVALLSDDDAARQYAETMKVLHLPPEAYKMRLVEIEGRRFLGQIDFPNRSGSSAFVAIYGASTPPDAIGDESVLSRVAGEFALFAPRRVRFYQPAHVPVERLTTQIDQHFLAGLACDMAARRGAPGLARVTLRRPGDLSFYARYVDAYNQAYLARPFMRGAVRTESEKALAESHAEGLLYEITVDGGWAGIVAARRQVIAGVGGTYMVEILLDSAARGQGLGPAVHQRFATRVAGTDPSAIITGTIAAVNVPSLKTATRAGRVEIGAWHWVDV